MLTAVGIAASPANACLMERPVPLEELARNADLVFKATVIADRLVTDAWFEPISGLEVRETQLRVVSIVKGVAPKVIKFRHYAPTARSYSSSPIEAPLSIATLCRPPSYTLALFRNYLISAEHVADDTYRQITKSPNLHDWSVLLAADANPHRGTTLREAEWTELQVLLKSAIDDDVLEAIEQLDGMSGAFGEVVPSEFARSQVLGAIRPLLKSKSSTISTAATTVVGR